jgi:hypothetical protein
MDQEMVNKVARAICAERCAFKGEYPCYSLAAAAKGKKYPPETCDDPGCEALARAAVVAVGGEA